MNNTVSFEDYLKKNFPSARFDALAAKNKNIIGAKLLSARKDRGLSQQAVCDLLSKYGVTIQKASYGKWEKGDTVPNAYQLLAVCVALRIEDGFRYFIGDVDLNPVTEDGLTKDLNPAGKKLLYSFSQYLVSTGKYRPASVSSPFVEYKDMPVYELGASAGPGQLLDEGHAEMMSFPEDSIPEEADFAVRVVGTSMEPIFRDGQYVWVQKCHSLDNGDIGIFEWNGCSYIKKYRLQMPEIEEWDLETEEDVKKYERYLEQFVNSEGVVQPEVYLVSYNTANGANPPKKIRPNDSFHIFGRVIKG